MSGTALDALKEFYADRDAREKQFEDLKAGVADPDGGQSSLSMEAFSENWNESQFWVSRTTSRFVIATDWGMVQYSQETATTLANQLLANTTNETVIAVVSAPSVFVQLKNILVSSLHRCWHIG